MIQMFKEYYHEIVVPVWSDVKGYYHEMIVTIWDNAKECFSELVSYFK